jgi:hypothetical protein
MAETSKFSDLVAGAFVERGEATADLVRRVGRGERIDLIEEAASCLSGLTRTAARFVLFWDNIATLLAEDPGAPLTFPEPQRCPEGERQTFKLEMPGTRSARAESGLRRRGEETDNIGPNGITLTAERGEIALEVDCSNQLRGLYEGTLVVVGEDGHQVTRSYNVYIDPGAQSS